MKKRYIFAIPHEKTGYIVDARNPYTWEECGAVVLPMDATEEDVMQAREKRAFRLRRIVSRVKLWRLEL